MFESVNLKSKAEYETPVTQPFITAEELKASLNVRPNITFPRIWNLIKCARFWDSNNMKQQQKHLKCVWQFRRIRSIH